jgi:hypothetical protein
MTTVQKHTSSAAAGAEIDRRAERYMAEHKCGYTEAWHAILGADKQLAEAYAAPATRVSRMATTDPRSAPAVPVTSAEEAEILEWVLRSVKDGRAGSLPGDLGRLSMETERFSRTGMPIEEAARRVMDLFPSLVAGAKMLIADLRRNRPENKPVADGETGLAQDKPEPGNPAGFVVHARAEALMQKHPHMDYREAVGAVLSEDRELKVRYAGVQR